MVTTLSFLAIGFVMLDHIRFANQERRGICLSFSSKKTSNSQVFGQSSQATRKVGLRFGFFPQHAFSIATTPKNHKPIVQKTQILDQSLSRSNKSRGLSKKQQSLSKAYLKRTNPCPGPVRKARILVQTLSRKSKSLSKLV